jgi:hypothetical protein
MKLLTSQKDTLFDLIEKKGLSPSQFSFSDKSSKFRPGQSPCLKFNNSEFYFTFDSKDNKYYSIYSPGNDKFVDEAAPITWDNQLYYFKEWVAYLIREISAPNKWERLKKELEEISINFDSSEDKFSFQEYEELKTKVAFLKQNISTVGLAINQAQAINAKLDHLTELAKDMNKFDWKSLFIGTIMSIIIQLSVTPDNAKTLWTLIRQAFNNYFLP